LAQALGVGAPLIGSCDVQSKHQVQQGQSRRDVVLEFCCSGDAHGHNTLFSEYDSLSCSLARLGAVGGSF